MGNNEIILGYIVGFTILTWFLILIWKFEVFPSPIECSENSRIIYLEIIIYSFCMIIFYSIDFLFLDPYFIGITGDNYYPGVAIGSLILFIIPLIYVRYKDKWKNENLGISMTINNQKLALKSILFFAIYGLFNTLSIRFTSWDKILCVFYSNAFLEEFLFRGIFQTKLEQVLGSKRALFIQGIIFMLIHAPTNILYYFISGDGIKLIGNFLFQLLVGVIFGVIFLKTRNLWIPVTCHYLSNWLGALVHFLFFSFFS